MRSILLTCILTLLYLFPSFAQEFLTQKGNQLFWNNQPQVLKSVVLTKDTYTSEDYQKLKSLGINTVYLPLPTNSSIEDFLPFLQKQLEFAKTFELWIIIRDISIPEAANSLFEKFADNHTLAGYELIPNRYQQLNLDKELRKIRAKDPNHLIIVRLPSTAPLLSDLSQKNVALSIDFSSPKAYTQQESGLYTTTSSVKYPSKNLQFPEDLTPLSPDTSNQKLPWGTTEWSYFEGNAMVANDSALSLRPVLITNELGPGRAYLGPFTVTEYSPIGKVTRQIISENPYELDGWELDNPTGVGALEMVKSHGLANNSGLLVRNTKGKAKAINNQLRFVPRPNHQYSISGFLKADALPKGSDVRLALEMEYSPSKDTVMSFDKQYLDYRLKQCQAFSEQLNRPVILELSLSPACFKGGRNGRKWLNDMIDLLNEHQLSFNYNSFDGQENGLFGGKVSNKDQKKISQFMGQKLME